MADSASDKINRLYNINKGGVTPEQLRNAKDADEFAMLLKKRGYYGFGKYGTDVGTREQNEYAAGLRAKMLRVEVIEFLQKNKVPIGAILLIAFGVSAYLYFKFKNK